VTRTQTTRKGPYAEIGKFSQEVGDGERALMCQPVSRRLRRVVCRCLRDTHALRGCPAMADASRASRKAVEVTPMPAGTSFRRFSLVILAPRRRMSEERQYETSASRPSVEAGVLSGRVNDTTFALRDKRLALRAAVDQLPVDAERLSGPRSSSGGRNRAPESPMQLMLDVLSPTIT
jgi:hypothetical protein